MENSFENKSFVSDVNNGDQSHSDDMNEEFDETSDTNKLMKSFCKNTSGHGFIRVSESSKAVKWIWIIIMSATFIGLIIHLILLVLRYFDFGINSAFYITIDNQLIMPDITVCPNQKFNFFSDYKIKYKDVIITPYNSTVLDGVTFYDLLTHYSQIWTFVNLSISERELARYSIMRQAYDAGLLRNKYDIIIRLSYKNENVDITTLSLTPSFDSSICVTFKPSIRSLSSLDGSDDTVIMLNIFMVGNDDQYEDLTKSFLQKENELSGATLYLHDPDSLPNFKTDGHNVNRGFLQIVSFSQRKIIRQNVNNRCIEKPENIVLRGFGLHDINSYKYSKNLCQETRKSEQIYKSCGCRSEVLLCPISIPETTPFCHQIPFDLYKNVNKSLYTFNKNNLSIYEVTLVETVRKRSLCHQNLIDTIELETFPKLCLPMCVENSYQFQVTSERIDRQLLSFKSPYNESMNTIIPIMKMNNKATDVMKIVLHHGMDITLNYILSIIRLNPKTFSVEVTEESLSYPIENFLSDIGGILGLYLGFSVMSMLEIFELLVQLVVHNVIKSKHRQA